MTIGGPGRKEEEMHPEDRVLVTVINHPRDFEIARDRGWYRVPEHKATPGVFFEYVAFYFTAAFGGDKWAVHYYARCLGHELVTRRALIPDEPEQPESLPRPAISLLAWNTPCAPHASCARNEHASSASATPPGRSRMAVCHCAAV